jgi:hypothetical protein
MESSVRRLVVDHEIQEQQVLLPTRQQASPTHSQNQQQLMKYQQ